MDDRGFYKYPELPPSTSPVRFAAVVVLYRCKVQDSASIQSLLVAHSIAGSDCDLKIIVFDNSAESVDPGPIPERVIYLPSKGNLGLANAYNRAIELAEAQTCEWILTLDQDTDLPEDFLIKLLAKARSIEGHPEIGAIVPQIISHNRIVSPNYFRARALIQMFPRGYVGIPEKMTFAFNSAATLRVSALRQVGGYDAYFWLDNSDAMIFRKLYQFGKRVMVAGDISVNHNFSMLEMNELISPFRYEHILLAEAAFWALELGRLAGAERIARLAARLFLKQLGKSSSASLRKLSARHLWWRLTSTRKQRIATFRSAVEKHLGDAIRTTALKARRPKISVCMAAYNGERYIDRQIGSILPQLCLQDELIIVDDCSTDGTVGRILAFGDLRILLIGHRHNAGLIATFEEAARNATGDIIFLADNDDIWAADKVSKFLREFDQHPDADVVMSAVSLIDSNDQPLENSTLDRNNKFRPGFFNNLVRNYYQGSAMAMRSRLLRFILPFPKGQIFLHDAWIGTTLHRIGGKAVFIQESLLKYRRHPDNFSRPHSWRKRVSLRLRLVWYNLVYAFRDN